jgi:hypothetical protein
MKLAALTVFPLLAAGLVTQPETETKQQIEFPVLHRRIPRDLEKRQFWDYLGSTLQQTLPGLLRWAADNITWMLSWQESPLKRSHLRPTLNSQAKKIALKYGPWNLIGSNETNTKIIIQMDPKSTILVRTIRGLPDNAAILSAKPALVFEDGSPATFNQGM